MSKKALFIVNPHSGKGLIKNYLLEIVDILVKSDYEVTIYTTQARKDDAGTGSRLCACSVQRRRWDT